MILEEQIQLVLTRVRDKVSRSSIYTAKILLETPMLRYYWKLQDTIGNSNAKILLETPMLRNYWNWHICHIRHILLLSRLSHLSRPSQYCKLKIWMVWNEEITFFFTCISYAYLWTHFFCIIIFIDIPFVLCILWKVNVILVNVCILFIVCIL